MNKKQVYIDKQDHFGRGITKINDRLIFVENALPLEKCEIEITNEKKNFSEAKVLKIIEESDYRTIPMCPFYYECGGCHIMHEKRKYQLEFKENKVQELLKRFADVDENLVLPIVYGKDFNYRNKIILRCDGKKLGFYREKTHDLISIDKCLITNIKINDTIKRLENYLEKYKEKIDEVMIRSTSLNEIMIVIKGNINDDNFIDSFKDVTSIYNYDKLIYGKDYIIEDIFGLKFKIYPTSFFQINYEVMSKLYQKVKNFYKDNNYNNVLDLYCGTGTIGMIIAGEVKNVVGVEVVESSINSALECMKINNIKNISFKCGKVENMIDSFNNIDSIIVDPPRKGLDKYTLDTILKINPETIIYISCDPVTLARDLKVLKQKYEVLEVTPFDMFPNTYHIENMVLLKQIDNSNVKVGY